MPLPTSAQVAGPSNGATLIQGTSTMSSTPGVLPSVNQTHSQSILIAQQQLARLQGTLPPAAPTQAPIRHPVLSTPLPQPTPQAPQPTPQQTAASSAFAALSADPNRQVPIQITLPPQAGVPDAQPRVLTIHVPASALTGKEIEIMCLSL